MPLSTKDSTSLNLQSGPIWLSFEKFRTEGAKALLSLKDGKVAILQTKTGQYRILEEHDFQELLGLARDVDRLRRGLRVLLHTARVVQKHPDADSLNLLVETVTMLGSLPELPTRDSFEPLLPEDIEIEPDDEVDIDPDRIHRPFDAHNTTLGE